MKKSFEIIRDLREDHDLKQSDIAAILQTTQQQYSKCETGKVDPPIQCFQCWQISTGSLLITCLVGQPVQMVWMHTKNCVGRFCVVLIDAGRCWE